MLTSLAVNTPLLLLFKESLPTDAVQSSFNYLMVPFPLFDKLFHIAYPFIILYIGNDLCISILPIRVQSGLEDVSDQDTPYQSNSSKF